MRGNHLTTIALALSCGIDSALQENRSELAARQATYQSAILSDIRGKINGSVFSKARGGIGTIRALKIPRNPRSTAQLTVRAAITALSAYWANTLTDPQRAAWNELATDTKSGFDQFIACNSLQQQAGNSIVAAAPATLNLPWLSIPDESDFVLEEDTVLNILLTGNGTVYTAAGNKLLFYIQRRIQRPGVANMSSNLVFAGALTSAASVMSLQIPAAIAAGIGTPTTADDSYVKMRAVKSTGEFTGEITVRSTWTEV